MGVTNKIIIPKNTRRDKAMIVDYQMKNNLGKYMLTSKEVREKYDNLTKQRFYFILKKRGIKTRTELALAKK